MYLEISETIMEGLNRTIIHIQFKLLCIRNNENDYNGNINVLLSKFDICLAVDIMMIL